MTNEHENTREAEVEEVEVSDLDVDESSIGMSELMEMMRLARSFMETSIDTANEDLEYFKFKKDFGMDCIAFTVDEIKEYGEEQIRDLYKKYYIGEESIDSMDVEDMRETILQIKSSQDEKNGRVKEYREISSNYNELMKVQFDQMHKVNVQKQTDAIAHLNQILSDEEFLAKTAPDVVESYKRKLHILESAASMSFLLDRMKVLGDKEKNAILDRFFDDKQGSYIIERWNAKAKKFGLDRRCYTYFINLEEKFLPEEYHVFNNLFLFNLMRFVAYADPYNKKEATYVRSAMNSLINLIYHKENNDTDQVIIKCIQEYDSFFFDLRDRFYEENTTRPGHPYRIEHDQKLNADQFNRTYAEIKHMYELNPDLIKYTDDELQEKSLQDIKSIYTELLESCIDKNIKKPSEGEAEVTEDENGVVSVEPTFIKDKYPNSISKITLDPVIPDMPKEIYCVNYNDEFQAAHVEMEDDTTHNCWFMLEVTHPDIAPFQRFMGNEGLLTGDAALDDIREEVFLEAANNFWFFIRLYLSFIPEAQKAAFVNREMLPMVLQFMFANKYLIPCAVSVPDDVAHMIHDITLYWKEGFNPECEADLVGTNTTILTNLGSCIRNVIAKDAIVRGYYEEMNVPLVVQESNVYGTFDVASIREMFAEGAGTQSFCLVGGPSPVAEDDTMAFHELFYAYGHTFDYLFDNQEKRAETLWYVNGSN